VERLRLAGAPLFFAYRRSRARPLASAAVVVALGGAVALIGWSSLTAADAQETNVRTHLAELPPRTRSLQVVYFMLPAESDFRAAPVDTALRAFGDVGSAPRRVRISHSIERNRPLGTRLVVVDDPRREVVVRAGRLPTGCCEALALTDSARPGSTVEPAPGVRLRIVGRGALHAGLVSDPSDLGSRALLVPSFAGPAARVVAGAGSTVVTTVRLEPTRVHAFALDRLRERLRTTMARLGRADSLVRASAPLGVLADLEHRGRVARERLLLVAGEGAALIVAFAAFVAAARRREAGMADEQLTDLGATQFQRWIARAAELVLPGLAGTLLALVGVAAGAFVVAGTRGLPVGFVGAALPVGTVLLMLAVGVVGALVLFGALVPRRRTRLGVGALELASVTALALIVWQAATTGALQPEDVGRSGAAPVIVLVPALAFFAAGVVLLRLVPLALRLGQRLGRRKPFVRLAFVTAARQPMQAAATTTFLAVALGASLFSLDYLATIDRQVRDQARFAVGAPIRTLAGGAGTPALRFEGAVDETEPSGSQLPVRVLALPAATIPRVLGWRDGFSNASRAEIGRRLRPAPVRLSGLRLASDASELRVWARAQTDYPRTIILRFLLPDQHFAAVELGDAFHQWRLLRAPVRLPRGTQLVAVQYEPTYTPISFKYDPEGYVDLGPIEQRRAAGWTELPTIGQWNATVSPDGRSGVLYTKRFRQAPVAAGTRFELSGTFQPIVHPSAGLPPPRSGFQVGAVPALAAGRVADQAVDGFLTVVVAGKAVPVHVVARAKLFPTIVNRPHDFLVVDYDTLFAALNSDEPGLAPSSERWLFTGRPAPPGALTVAHAEARLRNDPLAAGTRTVLGVTAIVAALLGLVGLVVATRSALTTERLVLAEYEALGVSPRALRRSAQLRLLVLSAVGVAAGLAGGAVGVRLVGALVAVTGTGTRPLPPIASVVDWTAAAVVVGALVAAAVGATALLAGRALSEPAARRLRA
jgi:FtsX-like permease family protein